MAIQRDTLLQAAWTAFERAYAPYSKYRVGAAIQVRAGDVFNGCNVEAANYGCTLCAERTAIVKAVSEGALKPGELEAVLVATRTEKPTSPCGSCRQVIYEFARADALILLSNQPGRIVEEIPLAELFPRAFGPQDLLGHNVS